MDETWFADDSARRYTIPVREECCQAWARAHIGGTDFDEFYALIRYHPPYRGPQKPLIGTNLLPIAFCPWCAAAKTARRLG